MQTHLGHERLLAIMLDKPGKTTGGRTSSATGAQAPRMKLHLMQMSEVPKEIMDKWLEGKSGSAPYGPTGSGKAGGGKGGKDVGRPSTAAPAAPELSAPPPKAAATVPPPPAGPPPAHALIAKAPPHYIQPQQQQQQQQEKWTWPCPNLSGLPPGATWPPQQPPVNYPPPANYQQVPPGYYQQQQPGYYQQLQPAQQQPPQSSAASSSWGGYQQPSDVQRQPSVWEEGEVDPAVIAKAAWG